MKIYLIRGHKTATKHLGNCLTCGKTIDKGQKYQYADPKRIFYFFHEECEVKQELIGKNTISEPATKTETEIQEQVDAVIREAASIEPKPAEPVESNQEPEATHDDNEVHVTVANCDKSIYCNKCKCGHVVGSRRYRQHKLYLGKSV